MIEPSLNMGTRDRRVALGLSERELADLAGVSRTSVRKADAGTDLRPVVRAAIDRALADAEEGKRAPLRRPGLYYVPREGGAPLHLTGDEGAPPITPPEESVLRALLDYARTQYGEMTAA